jgi:hypothetical protein
MDKIEIGEYGRTNKGRIFIFAWLEKASGEKYKDRVLIGDGKRFYNNFYYFEDGEEIVKHSKNIIDLIEVGDYVNGKRVEYVDSIEDGDGNERLCVFVEATQDSIEANDIKSIVTKEQFSQVEYKVEE